MVYIFGVSLWLLGAYGFWHFTIAEIRWERKHGYVPRWYWVAFHIGTFVVRIAFLVPLVIFGGMGVSQLLGVAP